MTAAAKALAEAACEALQAASAINPESIGSAAIRDRLAVALSDLRAALVTFDAAAGVPVRWTETVHDPESAWRIDRPHFSADRDGLRAFVQFDLEMFEEGEVDVWRWFTADPAAPKGKRRLHEGWAPTLDEAKAAAERASAPAVGASLSARTGPHDLASASLDASGAGHRGGASDASFRGVE